MGESKKVKLQCLRMPVVLFTLFMMVNLYVVSMVCAVDDVSDAILNDVAAGYVSAPVEYDIPYGSDDAQKLDVHMPDPTIEGPLAGIVLIHGGGWRVGAGKKEVMSSLAESIAKQGYVVFNVEYRLVPNAVFPAQMDDVQQAVRWVRAHAADYDVDPNRIGSIGYSAGGHLSALLATSETRDSSLPYSEFSSQVNCAVNYCGPTNFLHLHSLYGEKNYFHWIPMIEDLMGGTPEQRYGRYMVGSPAFHVLRGIVKPVPLVIFQSEADIIIPMENNKLFYRHLLEQYPNRDRDFLFFLYPAEPNATTGHAFGKEAGVDAQSKMLSFLAKHLSAGRKNSSPQFYPVCDQSVSQNSIVTFSLRAYDLDGDAVKITAKNMPQGAQLLMHRENTATFLWVPKSSQSGDFKISFCASDGVETTTDTVTISVRSLLVPFYRLWNASLKDHYYTDNEAQKNNAINRLGYILEGTIGYVAPVPVAGTVPLYRLYNAAWGDNFYTISANEKNIAMSSGYNYLGVAGYVHSKQDTGTIPLYRFYSNTNTDHFYTTNEKEKDVLIARGVYKYECVAAYINQGG